MAEAFIYMFVVGMGASLGVASTVLISYKVWQKMNKKSLKKAKGAIF